MKLLNLLIISFLMISPTQAEFVVPPEIVEGFVQSSIGESGGLYVIGVDETAFRSYTQSNWKSIIESIESIESRHLQTNETVPRTGLSLSSVTILGAACEELPPLEYLDYLDRVIELFGKNKTTEDALDLIRGVEKKQDFLSVNWEHPRVKTILAKIRKLIPPEDVDLLSCLDDIASGALADNYMYDKSDDAPLPETLPDIKLKRPWDSIIKKYERLTGKKLEEPYDSRFNPRPDKRDGTPDSSAVSLANSSPATGVSRTRWMICGLLLLAVAYAIRVIRKRKA